MAQRASRTSSETSHGSARAPLFKTHDDGFTVVELLIVVIVIAILVVITIIAYNGVTNRAKAAAAQSGSSQLRV